MGCRGICAPPPSSLTVVSAGLLLSLSQSSLWLLLLRAFIPPSEIHYPRGATTIADGLSLGQWWVGCIGSVRHGGRFWQLLTEVALPPLPCKPTTKSSQIFFFVVFCFLFFKRDLCAGSNMRITFVLKSSLLLVWVFQEL